MASIATASCPLFCVRIPLTMLFVPFKYWTLRVVSCPDDFVTANDVLFRFDLYHRSFLICYSLCSLVYFFMKWSYSYVMFCFVLIGPHYGVNLLSFLISVISNLCSLYFPSCSICAPAAQNFHSFVDIRFTILDLNWFWNYFINKGKCY